MKRFATFTLTSLLAGLAAAYLAITLFSEPKPKFYKTPTTVLPRPTTDSEPASYATAVELAAPSVVNIYTAKVTIQRSNTLFDDPLFKHFFGDNFAAVPRKKLQTSLGSGVIINQQGYILTNDHVVAEADEIKVVLATGQTLGASLVGTDPDTDLAVLRTEIEGLPAITVGDSQNLRVGDVVLAIGNPFGVGQTVTMGIVSATGRNQLGINTFENFIQTDAAINPGNSGGALINAYGELIGINTAIFSRSGGSQGIGFAIPITLAKGVMDQILERGHVIRGWLGIAGQNITPALAESFNLNEVHGVLISGVLEGGPADLAGIEPGDVITRIDNRKTNSAQNVLEIISTLKPGSKVKVHAWRGKQKLEFLVLISERPQLRK